MNNRQKRYTYSTKDKDKTHNIYQYKKHNTKKKNEKNTYLRKPQQFSYLTKTFSCYKIILLGVEMLGTMRIQHR